MEDFVEFFKTTLTILAVVFFIIIGMLFYASGKVENSYQIALKSMNEGKWQIALSNFEEIPNYKDASDLYIFAYPHNIYYANYESIEETVSNYNEALSFINYNKPKLKDSVNSKYAEELLELEKVLKFKLVALNVKKQNTIMQKDFEDCVKLIENEDYQKALQKLNIISDQNIYGSDKKQLINYVNLKIRISLLDKSMQDKKYDNNNTFKELLPIISDLNPNYTGPLSQEIQKTVQAYIDLPKWNEVYNKDKIKEKNLNTNNEIPNLEIGMKEESVLQVLGSPLKQNTISNKYGVFKELTFSNNLVIYFENNTATAIKG